MTKNELQKMIQAEVHTIIRRELPQIVKPLVQEAVAGALANLLAEGIVKGAPKTVPAKPESAPVRTNRTVAPQTKGQLDELTRRRLASEMGYGSIEKIGEAPRTGNNLVSDILAETANDMREDGGIRVDSILDSASSMEEYVAPEAIAAMTRDYTALMQKLNGKK